MEATAFDEENGVTDPPTGMNGVESLSVFRGSNEDGVPVVISCWKPTTEEWVEMKRTGRVWVVIMGKQMPPIAVTGTNPFYRDPPTTGA